MDNIPHQPAAAATPEAGPQPAAATKPLIERARDIILTPKTEWQVIEREPATIQSIFTSYVLILAAIGPIAGLIGGQLFGMPSYYYTWRPTLAAGITTAVVTYAMSLASVYVLAKVIEAMAPSFGGTKNELAAVKLAAYSFTAAWLAGLFALVPALGILALVGLYSLYLLYIGLPVMMKVPAKQALTYTVVAIVVAGVLLFIVNAIAGIVIGIFAPTAYGVR